MSIRFEGRWRGRVIQKNAGFSQRIVVSGASLGNGNYAGVVGTVFEADGGNWQVDLQWNNDITSGWQASAVIESVAMTSPLVVIKILRADDNFPPERDGDFDDLEVWFEHLDPAFKVIQRPFALDRGTLTMLPDGIFEASQGVQYMGVRIRNTWFFDWDSGLGALNMKIGIAPTSRIMLASQGIQVIDNWTPQEQEALGQAMDGGFVRVPNLAIGDETLVYFKVNCIASAASKPDMGFVAQRDAFDPMYDTPSRIAHKKIFVSRSSYDPVQKEVMAQVPEGLLRLRLKSAIIDRTAATKAATAVRACLSKHPGSAGMLGKANQHRLADELRSFLQALLEGKDVDPCKLHELLAVCAACDSGKHDIGIGDNGGQVGGYPGGGLGDGSGADDWCRFKPIAWLPVEFEYRLELTTPYGGQFGPLAFEDPWWKVILIILAVLLAIASLIADYVGAAQDSRFIIGKVVRKGNASTNRVDCALSDLNGSRSVNLGELDAQGDDVNNGSPVSTLDTIIQLDRSDNGNFGVQNAVLGNVVWKSGGTSGTTRGEVTDIAFSTNVNYDGGEFISGTINYTGQVLVTQLSTLPQPLSQGGDSGAVWVDLASGRPVALNFAGDLEDVGVTGVGNPIRAVVDTLDIRFNP